MLKKVRITSALMVLALSLYGLSSNNNSILPFTMAGLAIMMVVMGAEERQKNRKSYRSYLFFAVSLLLILVSIEGLIY
ncbi:DUF3953 domain-containing protein [Rossellomorea vietnamensis]|uniref:DUF3953 domain-containing protein n=1 Tax=Rossellomorea vietnamensis TaxID=218284 RepID=UPI00077C5CBB|nr:DUF3953 domain-containing protein [Rossellomorea vietnamensis]OXS64436.1 hypothetical protein B1B00_01540 [Bacillus sp. DSM 27956]PRX79583.1 uncharacterized protein DUF3953 [Bacillus sp. V-88]SLJ98601.1 Protein of unknown function [Bacillus sp. V-88]